MKRLLLTLALIAATVGVCNAQLYIGGSIGYNIDKSKNSDLAEAKSASFTFSPRIGYVFNEEMLAGLKFSYQSVSIDEGITSWGDDSKMITNSIGVAPYLRYNFVSLGRFTFGVETTVAAAWAKVKDAHKSGFSLGLNVAPVISFGINDHWWLETCMNLFSLTYIQTKVESPGLYELSKNSQFNVGLSGDGIFSLGDLSFGVVYRF